MEEREVNEFMTAPLLRGLTFDGVKGNIVITAHQKDLPPGASWLLERERKAEAIDILSGRGSMNNCGGMPFFIGSESLEDIICSFQEYVETYRTYPGIVIFSAGSSAGTDPQGGSLYFLGSSWEEAAGIEANVLSPRPKPVIRSYSKQTNAAGCEEGKSEAAMEESLLNRKRHFFGKTALVTGAARGLGAEIARALSAAGCYTCIADVNHAGAERLAEELNQKYSAKRVCSVPADVRDERSVAETVHQVVDRFGGIDIFVSNAGVLRAGGVASLSLEDFQFVNEVNYTGYFLGVKYVSPVMAMQNRPNGRYVSDIIQINSKSGLEGSDKNSAYSGSKFGGIGLTRSFAKELLRDNIKVNAVCPGNYFDGPLWSDPESGLFTQYLREGKVPGAETADDVREAYESRVPMRRGCTGEDVARAVFYIIEQKYETGQALPVTGGQIMLR